MKSQNGKTGINDSKRRMSLGDSPIFDFNKKSIRDKQSLKMTY